MIGAEYNFDLYDSTAVQLLRTPYDTGISITKLEYFTITSAMTSLVFFFSESIMHYESNAFALKQDLPTITKKDGSRIDGNKVFTKVRLCSLYYITAKLYQIEINTFQQTHFILTD